MNLHIVLLSLCLGILLSCNSSSDSSEDVDNSREQYFDCKIDDEEFISHVQVGGKYLTTNNSNEIVHNIRMIGNTIGSIELMVIDLAILDMEPTPGRYETVGKIARDARMAVACSYTEDADYYWLTDRDNTTVNVEFNTLEYEDEGWLIGTFSAIVQEESGNRTKQISDGKFRLKME